MLYAIFVVGFVLFPSAVTAARRAKFASRDAVYESVQAGLNSVTHPSIASPQDTLDAVVEQYIGILPPATLDSMQSGQPGLFRSLESLVADLIE